MRRAAPLLALVVSVAGCSDVAVDCWSFSTWEACPIEEGCGWGYLGGGTWRCVTPCESDDDCDEGTCDEVGSGSGRGMEDVHATFDACVQ